MPKFLLACRRPRTEIGSKYGAYIGYRYSVNSDEVHAAIYENGYEYKAPTSISWERVKEDYSRRIDEGWVDMEAQDIQKILGESIFQLIS